MSIEMIRQAIMQDEANQAFTAQGWQPIFMANPNAQLLIIGQAPGSRTQERGTVFKDKSGDRLRRWLQINEYEFYTSDKIAVLPLDFYFPGKAKTGDLPPRIDFTKKWHPLLLEEMPKINLTLLIGKYAQTYYLKDKMKGNMTQTVLSYSDYLPTYFPLPHPSPLNFRWYQQHPEFETGILPALRHQLSKKG